MNTNLLGMNAKLLGSRQQNTINQALFGRRYELTFRVYYARRRNRFIATVDGREAFDAQTQLGLLNMMRESVNEAVTPAVYRMANVNARNQWTNAVSDGYTTFCLLPSGNLN